MAKMTGELAALVERAREFGERCYRQGVEYANADIEQEKGTADPVGWLTSSLARAQHMIADLEKNGNVAWTSRGYRDTLVEYRDSMAD